MNKCVRYIFLIVLISLMYSCGNDKENITGLETKRRNDLTNYDDYLKSNIIGTWTTYETVRGETVVFDANGTYSGYDGREEYKGEWKIKNHRINLTTGGLFWIKITADTMILDSMTYVKEHHDAS